MPDFNFRKRSIVISAKQKAKTVTRTLLPSWGLSGLIGLTFLNGSSPCFLPLMALATSSIEERSPHVHPHLSPSNSRYQMLRSPRFPILAPPMPRNPHATQTRDGHPAFLTRNLRGRGYRSRSAQGTLESQRRWMLNMRGRQTSE